MQYEISYAAGAAQRDFGRLFTIWQYDNLADSVKVTLTGETRTISGVDIVVRRPDGYSVIYSYIPSGQDEKQYVSIDGSTITWAIDAVSTYAIGSADVQMHVWFDGDAQGVLAAFRFTVKQAHSISADSYMAFPTVGEIAEAEGARSAAESARVLAEQARMAQAQAVVERCIAAAQRCEGLALQIVPPPYWVDVLNKPTSFTPSAHAHGISDVNGLQTALNGKENSGAAAAVQGSLNTHTADAVAHVSAAERMAWNAKASSSHTHSIEDITDFAGVIRYKASDTFSIAVDGWTENSDAGRYEYVLTSEDIRTTSRVTIILNDAHKGKHNLWALDPSTGSVTICIDDIPLTAITGRYIVDEVIE